VCRVCAYRMVGVCPPVLVCASHVPPATDTYSLQPEAAHWLRPCITHRLVPTTTKRVQSPIEHLCVSVAHSQRKPHQDRSWSTVGQREAVGVAYWFVWEVPPAFVLARLAVLPLRL